MLIETQIPPITPIVDHGDLTGLGDNDHTQYVLADGSRAMQSCTVTTLLTCANITCSGSVACDGVILGTGAKLTMAAGMGELYWDNNRLTLNSNNTMIITSYYAIDIVSSDDVIITSDYTDIELLAPSGVVKVTNLYAPDGIEFDTYGTENISSSTGDMFYSAYFGHTFDSVDGNPLRSMTGYASGDGNAGLSTFTNGMAFEDGLLVFVA